jgi:hypothetical protein
MDCEARVYSRDDSTSSENTKVCIYSRVFHDCFIGSAKEDIPVNMGLSYSCVRRDEMRNVKELTSWAL